MKKTGTPGKPLTRRRKTLLIAGVILALAGVAAGIWYVAAYLPKTQSGSAVDRVGNQKQPGSKAAGDLVATAQAQQDAGDTAGALATLDGSVEGKPATSEEKVVLLVAKANILVNTQRYDEALATYTQAIAIAPDNYILYQGRGSVYELQGKNDVARTEYQKALELARDPNNPTPHGPLDPTIEIQSDLKRLGNA